MLKKNRGHQLLETKKTAAAVDRNCAVLLTFYSTAQSVLDWIEPSRCVIATGKQYPAVENIHSAGRRGTWHTADWFYTKLPGGDIS